VARQLAAALTSTPACKVSQQARTGAHWPALQPAQRATSMLVCTVMPWAHLQLLQHLVRIHAHFLPPAIKHSPAHGTWLWSGVARQQWHSHSLSIERAAQRDAQAAAGFYTTHQQLQQACTHLLRPTMCGMALLLGAVARASRSCCAACTGVRWQGRGNCPSAQTQAASHELQHMHKTVECSSLAGMQAQARAGSLEAAIPIPRDAPPASTHRPASCGRSG